MRILFVIEYYHPYIGGAEYIFKQLAEKLASRGHSVKVVTTHLKDTDYSEILNGVEIERVKVPAFADRIFFGVLGILKMLKNSRSFDIIHTTPYTAAPAAFLAAKLTRRPIVYTSLEVIGNRWKDVEKNSLVARIYKAVERFVVKLPYDWHASISEATQRDTEAVGVKASKTSVIYPGVDDLYIKENLSSNGQMRKTHKIAADDFVYLYFGRPGITKGVEYLIRAAELIQQDNGKAHLALVLAEEPRAEYLRMRHMVEESRVSDHIHLVEATHDRRKIANYILSADCVVVPSITEGFGLTTAEACALNIPVVATHVGSIPEVISGRHLLIKPGSPEAISRAVLRIQQGDWEQTPKKIFSWDRMVSEYEDVYRELLGS